MKRNKIVFIITILLIAFACYFIYKSSKGVSSLTTDDFVISDTSLVTKIFLTDKQNNKVLLEKNAPGDWTVNKKFAASSDLVSILLKTMLRIEVKSPVAKAARDNVVRRLSSVAKKAEIYQTVYRIDFWGIHLFPHEKLVKTFYVGDATQDNLGTYMLLDGSDDPYIMHIPGFRGFLNSRFSTLENDWRDHTLFNIEMANIKSVQLAFPSSPDSSFIINNVAPGKYTLTALKPKIVIPDYDTIKLLKLLTSFVDVKFESLVTDNIIHNKDSIIMTTPFHILTITEMNGKAITIKTFHKSAPGDQEEIDQSNSIYDLDRLFVQFNQGKDFGLIQFYIFDNILRPLTYYLKPATGKVNNVK